MLNLYSTWYFFCSYGKLQFGDMNKPYLWVEKESAKGSCLWNKFLLSYVLRNQKYKKSKYLSNIP